MQRFRGLLVISAMAILAAGCGGQGSGADVPDTDGVLDAMDTVGPDADDVAGDMLDRDNPGDAAMDSAGDGTANDAEDGINTTDTADVAEVAIYDPIRDRAFAQEINHTGIEVDGRITDIVDVVVRPSWAPAAFDAVVMVGPDGFFKRGDSSTGDLTAFSPNPGLGRVIGAAFGPIGLFLIQESGVVLSDGLTNVPTPPVVTPNGSFSAVATAGDWTLFTDGDLVHAITSEGLHDVTTATVGLDIKAMTVNRDHTRLYLAGTDPAQNELIMVFGLSDTGVIHDPIAVITAPVSGITRMTADVSEPLDLELVVVGTTAIAGFYAIDSNDSVPAEIPVFAANRVPLTGATDIAETADGGFIVTTNGGAYRMIDRGDGPEWRVYNTMRWVTSEDVRAVATTPEVVDSPIYFGTAAGMTWVTVEQMTIQDKMDLLREKIELRHDRDGAVADSRLTVPGDLSTNIPWDSDNDGGWTSYWLIAECMRWKVTGDAGARANFDKSLQAMLNLRLLTGEDWFLARSLIRKDGCQLDDCDNPDDGEWYTSPDGEWWVKSDTSNDEVTSHMFMMGPAYDLCADETQKHAIAAHVSNIVGGIIDHGYQLWKPTGECTTYGQFDPGYVNLFGLFGDGGQRSVQTLAALNLAIHVTADQESKLTDGQVTDMPASRKFIDAKAFLMNDENHYDDNVLVSTDPPARHGNGDGDELSTQAFFILVQYEDDPLLKAMWLDGWASVHHYVNMQQDAVWEALDGVITRNVPDMYLPERWYRLYPLDLIRWTMHNTHRLDLIAAPTFYTERFDGRFMRSDGRIVPADERPNDRHNTCQFMMDGGWGSNTEMDAADVLAAYWMSRYYGFVLPAE